MSDLEEAMDFAKNTSDGTYPGALFHVLHDEVLRLTAALSKEEKRAEAAIKMLKQSNPCNHCTHFADDKYCNYCDDQCSNFKWRDPTEQEEST